VRCFGTRIMHKIGSAHYPDTQHSIALACSAAVCQHMEQHGQKEVKKRPKRGQKEAKNGQNRLSWSQPREPTPQSGTPRVRSGQKVRFGPIWTILLQGVIQGPPSKKHGFVEVAEIQTLFSPIFEKKCGFSPRRMVQRGGNPHFFSKIGDNGVWISATFLKKWPKRGVPLFG